MMDVQEGLMFFPPKERHIWLMQELDQAFPKTNIMEILDDNLPCTIMHAYNCPVSLPPHP